MATSNHRRTGDAVVKCWGKKDKRGRTPPSMRPHEQTYDDEMILAAETLMLLSQHPRNVVIPPQDSSPPSPPVINSSNTTVESSVGSGAVILRPEFTPSPLTVNRRQPSVGSDGGNRATSTSKRKIFQCALCHEIFPSGQALGGHKRKHYTGTIIRNAAAAARNQVNAREPVRRLDFDLNLFPPEALN